MNGRLYIQREVAALASADEDFVIHCVEEEWIRPAGGDSFDDADLARLRLIVDLKNDFGANDESIPLILHLLDQLYTLRSTIRARG